jgi:hypothetical protein
LNDNSVSVDGYHSVRKGFQQVGGKKNVSHNFGGGIENRATVGRRRSHHVRLRSLYKIVGSNLAITRGSVKLTDQNM